MAVKQKHYANIDDFISEHLRSQAEGESAVQNDPTVEGIEIARLVTADLEAALRRVLRQRR